MLETVKYQLDRAEESLRSALELGATKEDPYLLRNIADMVNTVNGWQKTFKFKYNLDKLTTDKGIKFNMSSTNSNSNLTNLDLGLDEQPYYVGSHVKGGMGEDVISFGGNTTMNSSFASF